MAAALPEDMLRSVSSLDALLIAGPTASGKSALAIAAARATGGCVINADSMQVYAGLRILTARPSPEEELEAEHLLYGVVDPRRAFSVGDYIRAAGPLLAELKKANRLAVITGGTGLYFRALTEGLVETPQVSADVSREVERLGQGVALHRWLSERDPERAAALNPADTPRLQRAAALFLTTGLAMRHWLDARPGPLLAAGRWRGIFLQPEREALYGRIDARFQAMIAAGALDEARAIRSLGLLANRGVMKAHGMPHLLGYLAGDLALDEAIALGQRDTRNYAKRQLTWARRYMADWQWLSA